MPPKKVEEPKKGRLGRVGTNLKVGIVGLPNVGKSTFFNVLCSQAIAAENFPFCTIDPNTGKVKVPDERFEFLCKKFNPLSRVPAHLTVVDIAGLVKGASEGTGLGNAFLSHIKDVDAIFHMLRAFDSDDIVHVEGDVDPVRDLSIIADELRLKDVEYAEKACESITRAARNDKVKQQELAVLIKARDVLHDQKSIRHVDWNAHEIDVLNQHLFITAKPIIYLVNITKKDYIKKKNKHLIKIKEWIDQNDPGAGLIPFSADFETEYSQLDDEGKAQMETENAGLTTALPKIIKQGYAELNLMYYFTSGPDEVRAWTIQRGTKAPKAAGKIHTDFENGFIAAEVMSYKDFETYGSEAEVKAHGKYLQKGREYEVEDGDIMFFKANTGAGLNKKK